VFYSLVTPLLREKHIGAYKAQVAAQQVALLNPALRNRVRGLTLKVGPETESVFDAAFWGDTDLVITALVSLPDSFSLLKMSLLAVSGCLQLAHRNSDLCALLSLGQQDNVAAREYVDSMCVKHCRWMLDSGTLGTKGNTQVRKYHSKVLMSYVMAYSR